MNDSLLYAHVVVKTLNLAISCCYFVEYGEEMYTNAGRTCTRIIFLFKPIIFLFRDVAVAVAVVVAKAP